MKICNEDILDDPVELEVWRNLLSAVTEEMGAVLTRSAFSANIKERRDLSCALFSPSGEMVSHAAHIPVHLGSTPLAVKAILESIDPGPGDIALVNDPYRGGTHLPDITVAAPVFINEPDRKKLLAGYVVNRAHHADVGGEEPGSMSPVDHIDREGISLPPMLIAEKGIILEKKLHELFYSRVRSPMERKGDLSAQIAACLAGIRRIEELAENYGSHKILNAMNGLVFHSEKMMRDLLKSLPDGTFRAEDYLDDDGMGSGKIIIRTAITINNDTAIFDFSGSSPQVKGPLNAVSAVTASAVLYALRCIAPSDIPASTGLMKPIEIIAPEGTIVNAVHPAAVAGGNVETSQRLADVIFAAFSKILPNRIPASSQGTMNNISMGSFHGKNNNKNAKAHTAQDNAGDHFDEWVYYETLGGGSGGGPGFKGESAIHTHMTNTLNTPVEALEYSFPVRLLSMRIRRGSGGFGRYSGGDGLERRYLFLKKTRISLLCERRKFPPPGLAGGNPGKCGENFLERNGKTIPLPGKTSFIAEPEDILIIRTPGGGGFGSVE